MEFTEVLSEHGSMMKAVMAGFKGRNTDVDDLWQEACLAVWQAVPKYRSDQDCQMQTYLSNCVRNALIQRTRRDNLFYFHNIITLDVPVERHLSDLTTIEVNEIMRRAADACHLRSYQRGIYAVAKKMEGQSYRKTAIELGVSHTTIKRHRRQAVQVLKKMI